MFLQAGGTTLEDVWLARTIIEPPAAGLLGARRDARAIAELVANIGEAPVAAKSDLIRYADLTADFSMLITRHCGNRTLALFAALIHDIIRRQHEDVTSRTIGDAKVDRLRLRSLASRERLVELLRDGASDDAEQFWRLHLKHMRDLVLAAYPGAMTIDVLAEPTGRLRPIGRVRRAETPAPP